MYIKRHLFFFICIGLFTSAHNYTNKLPIMIRDVYHGAIPCVYVDFDESMQTSRYNHIIFRKSYDHLIEMSGFELMDFFRSLYDQNNYLHVEVNEQERIPKIIHQIWIGDSVPKELKKFQQTWQDHHPEWKYRLWTQDDIPKLTLHNKALIEQAKNPGEKADLLRYEILYQYGGVYIDMDFECLQPLDVLHHAYDFYVGMQPLDSGLVQLGIGIIGSISGHPMLKACIESVAANYEKALLKNNICGKTGPVHFTRLFVAHAGKHNLIDIALPAHYFYPLGPTRLETRKQEWIMRGSFGIHHWAKTWNKPELRRRKFRSIKSWGELL